MAKINLLDKKVYNRISAGEVVERPASVVKELVENAIDAGAASVNITIEVGGTTLISVRDDGCGIEREELKKAFMPHATSKISRAEDLDNIMTLGFRGEALASIGAVSRATVISKPQSQDMGYAVDCIEGEISEPYENPAISGTTVIVKDLFCNTPVRERFLKSVKGEEAEVISTAGKMALSRPDVAFTLVVDGKTVLQTYGGGLKECVSCIYGSKAIDNCFMIEGVKNGIRVSGFVGKLSFTKPTRAFQTLIVNGRFVVDNTVSSAVSNAYGGYLMKRQYPFYVLNLEIPGEAVDVNVHPRKAEVRFSNNQIVYSAVYSTVSSVLDGTSAALDIIKDEGVPFPEAEAPSTAGAPRSGKLDVKAEDSSSYAAFKPTFERVEGAAAPKAKKSGFSYATAKDTRLTFEDSGYMKEMAEDKLNGVDVFAENKEYIEKLDRAKKARELEYKQQELEVEAPMLYIGQIFETYLIFQKGSDMFMIDQHAAHERLIYDQLCERVKGGRLESQPLLMPYTFTASGEDFMSIYTRLDYFRQMGIELDNVGDYSFKVSAVPCDLCEINLKEFFDDVLYDNAFKRESIPLTLKEKLMQKACKHAIKAGDKLSQSDIDALMAKLNGNLGLRCPHGRPVAVRITKAEIEKWFKRTV